MGSDDDAFLGSVKCLFISLFISLLQTDTKRGVQQKIECAAGQCVKTKEVLECGRLKVIFLM